MIFGAHICGGKIHISLGNIILPYSNSFTDHSGYNGLQISLVITVGAGMDVFHRKKTFESRIEKGEFDITVDRRVAHVERK